MTTHYIAWNSDALRVKYVAPDPGAMPAADLMHACNDGEPSAAADVEWLQDPYNNDKED